MDLIFLLYCCNSNLQLLHFDLGSESVHPVIFHDWVNQSRALQLLQSEKRLQSLRCYRKLN